MLRLIHNQTVSGGVLVDDIDDGMPNKQTYRLGSDANPKSYARDGYANDTKQPCYVPYAKATDTTIAGYIDLNQTPRVTLSAGKGKISKLAAAGLVSVVSFSASDLGTPVVTTADLDTPGAGDVTITGTKLLSVIPNESSVVFTGTGAITLTQTQIIAGGGSVSDTVIVILAASVPGLATTTSSATVIADDLSSNTAVLT